MFNCWENEDGIEKTERSKGRKKLMKVIRNNAEAGGKQDKRDKGETRE